MNSEDEILRLLPTDHLARKTNSLHHFTLRQELIAFPTFQKTVEEIALLHYRRRQSKVSEGLLIYGQHGSGKSTAIKHYVQQFKRTRVEGVIKIPVLFALTPETPSVVSLSDVILTSLGDPLATRGTAAAKLNRIVHFFIQCGVEMLVLDEFHHFYDTHRILEGRRVSDWLKNLMNLTGICIVLVGLPRSIAALNANPQLRRRFSAPLHHAEFKFNDINAQREFRALLSALEKKLPIKCKPSLSDPEMARRMFYATKGLIDYVVKIIDDAIATSDKRSEKYIGLEELTRAFKRKVWAECPDWINPFLAERLRQLTHDKEPFSDWDEPLQYINSARTRNSYIMNKGDGLGGVSNAEL